MHFTINGVVLSANKKHVEFEGKTFDSTIIIVHVENKDVVAVKYRRLLDELPVIGKVAKFECVSLGNVKGSPIPVALAE